MLKSCQYLFLAQNQFPLKFFKIKYFSFKSCQQKSHFFISKIFVTRLLSILVLSSKSFSIFGFRQNFSNQNNFLKVCFQSIFNNQNLFRSDPVNNTYRSNWVNSCFSLKTIYHSNSDIPIFFSLEFCSFFLSKSDPFALKFCQTKYSTITFCQIFVFR